MFQQILEIHYCTVSNASIAAYGSIYRFLPFSRICGSQHPIIKQEIGSQRSFFAACLVRIGLLLTAFVQVRWLITLEKYNQYELK